jgi:hypothetical protein
MSKGQRPRKTKLAPGMVFAITRPNGGFYLIVHLASNQFGEAFGLTAGWQTDPTLAADLRPHPRMAHVYTDSKFASRGQWRYVGDRLDLLAFYPAEPEIYHLKSDNLKNPEIGPYGSAERASNRLRFLSEEEYRTSPIANSDYRQIMLEEQVEKWLQRWEVV